VQLYSAPFIRIAGLAGAGTIHTVPVGHTYVIKQLTAYSNPTLGRWTVHFRSVTTGETRWSAGGQIGAEAWFGFFGSLVFLDGEEFQFTAGVTPGDGVDVYAGGYDFVNP
jgi:hypothetical protein